MKLDKALKGLDGRLYGGFTHIVAEGHYCGFGYQVKSIHGSHPTAYVFKDNAFKLNLSEGGCLYDVHGGITYEDDEKIGWDYAHGEDFEYSSIPELISDGKKWTLEEIVAEIKAAIRKIPRELLAGDSIDYED